MYLVIGADMVPTETNIDAFESGEMEQVISEDLNRILKDASYRIFNLEVPLTDQHNPIKKSGPNLIASCASVNGYKAIGADMLTLANNHIMDQGEEGLKSTIDTLSNNGIHYVGVGNDSAEAMCPSNFCFGNKKIGVYACCEHEFSSASVNSPGANTYDPLYSFDSVEKLRKETDYVIVLYHGGKEHYRYPSPELQRICRRFAEKGADLIVCQHSHCIGCEEKYGNSVIVYGQGNFLFDRSDSEYWKTGILLRVDDQFNISYIPILKNGNGVKLADEEASKQIMGDFELRSDEIRNPSVVKEKYDEFASDMMNYYLETFKGKESIIFRGFNKLFKNRLRERDIKKRYGQYEMLHLLNFIECEAHSELMVRGLELKIYE